MGDTKRDPPDKPSWNDLVNDEQTPPSPTPTGGSTRRSWASVLGSGLPHRSDNNVLEVVLEKDQRGSFYVTEAECVNLMGKLGIDPRPGIHVEGVQICPQGRGVIYITLKKQVQLSRFCKYEVLEVTRSGTRAVLTKPAGKREVVITARGLHPNTADEVVVDYLGKFGKVVTNKVVYGVFTEGPLKGIKNGDRSYKMEIKPGTSLGSYHAIDGNKVTLKYPRQQQTCARCHRTAQNCKGKGVAKRCEAEGGIKVDFIDHILDLWKNIGYTPQSPEAIANIETTEEDLHQQEGGNFTPTKVSTNPEKYSGVSIKTFPKGIDDGLIMEFLIKCGLPEPKKENVQINKGAALVRALENDECKAMIDAIHGKTYFDRKLYCNGIIGLTPEKTPQPLPPQPQGVLVPSIETEEPLPPQPQEFFVSNKTNVKPFSPEPDMFSKAPSSCDQTNASQLPIFQSLSTHPVQAPHYDPLARHSQETGVNVAQKQLSNESSMFDSRETLVRRHSISTIDRTPPPKSLAADLLGLGLPSATLMSTRSIFSNISQIQDSLSDFNSCLESEESSGISEEEVDLEEDKEIKTANDRKRDKKNKRKIKWTPTKDQFIKKQNIQSSPTNL